MKRNDEMPPSPTYAEMFTSPLSLSRDQRSGGEWKFRTLIDAVSELVITLDSRGRVREWNEAAVALFGYEAREAQGRDFFGLVSPQHPLEQLAVDGADPSGKGARRQIGLVARRKTGEEFPLEITLFEAPSGGGEDMLAIARDPRADGVASALKRICAVHWSAASSSCSINRKWMPGRGS